MWLLPTALRAKMAMVLLIGIFFIPFATSDLRGLPHILTCQDEVSASLYVDNEDAGPIVGSADSTSSDEVGVGLCGGLDASLQVTGFENDRVAVLLVITNRTEHDWRGSMALRVDGTAVPVSIGSIAAGDSESDTVDVRVAPGSDSRITGTLRIGP